MSDDDKGERAAQLRLAAKLLDAEAERLTPAAEAKSPLERRLKAIGERILGGNVGVEELQRLQIETNVLETLMTAATNFHHHDTNEHHDHETHVLNPGVFEVRKDKG